MTKQQAIKLARYHKFTKKELYQILVNALENLPEDYWKKPNKVNKIFDNGYYFNRCRDWLNYKEGEDNDTMFSKEIITVRILEGFGKFSKVQLPKKKRVKIEVQGSEKPSL